MSNSHVLFHDIYIFSGPLHGGKLVLSCQPCPLTLYAREGKDTMISCGGDNKVKIFTTDGTILAELSGHEQPVETVCFPGNELMITGSWDGSFKVWKEGKELHSYKDAEHKFRVNVAWCQAANTLVTTSGNGVIVLYTPVEGSEGEFKRGRVIQGAHSDALRGVVPDASQGGFVTFSNDGTSKRFTSAGDEKQTFVACDRNVCYAATVTPEGEVAAGGEGEPKACKVFSLDGKTNQSLPQAGVLLSVNVLPNGDIVTGCGGKQSFVRIWSKHISRQLSDEDATSALAVTTANTPAPQASSGSGGLPANIKVESVDVLQQPGEKHGAVKIVNYDGVNQLYQWDEIEYQWEHQGEVTTKPPQKTKYDFEVTVDLGGGAALPLKFNRTDDTYAVAVQFVTDNRLDQFFIPQIQQYIENLVR